MLSPIENERSEIPSPEKLKLVEEPSDDESKFSNYDSDDWETLSDDLRLLDEEWGKSGGFDVDFSKVRHRFGRGAVHLDDDNMVSEPHETNRDLLNRLSNMAISFYNDKTGIKLELVKVLRANFHPSAAITLYITFEANDPSDGNQTKRYQAVVRYLSFDIEVCSCNHEPSSS